MIKLFILFTICLFSCFSFLWSNEISENEQSIICRIDQLIKNNNKILVSLLDIIQKEQTDFLSFINYSETKNLNNSLEFEKTRKDFQTILDYFDNELRMCLEAQNETCEIKSYRANMMFRFSLYQRMIFYYEDLSNQYFKYLVLTCNKTLEIQKETLSEKEFEEETKESEQIYSAFVQERKKSYNTVSDLFIKCFNLLDENVDILEKESEK
jgi:predicted RNA-binding protein with RPS1 domain